MAMLRSLEQRPFAYHADATRRREQLATPPTQWWQTDPIIDIYVPSGIDTKGTGYGTLLGTIPIIDLSHSLGFGAVKFSPIFECEKWVDMGYGVSDYYKINPNLGTNKDLDKVLDELAQRNMRLIIDIPESHGSIHDPKFQRSRRSSEYEDWYIWKDKDELNNWPSFFEENAWHYDSVKGKILFSGIYERTT